MQKKISWWTALKTSANTGWSLTTGPKTKCNNSRFCKQILENNVGLDSWDIGILPYYFSNSTFLMWWLPDCIQLWAILSYRRRRFSWILIQCILSTCRKLFSTRWQFEDVSWYRIFLNNPRGKIQGQRIWKPSWPVKIPNRKISFPWNSSRRSDKLSSRGLCL